MMSGASSTKKLLQKSPRDANWKKSKENFGFTGKPHCAITKSSSKEGTMSETFQTSHRYLPLARSRHSSPCLKSSMRAIMPEFC